MAEMTPKHYRADEDVMTISLFSKGDEVDLTYVGTALQDVNFYGSCGA